MRAAVVVGAFGLGNLRVIDVDPPKPGPGQVLLRIRAASLNYRDLMVAEGSYNPRYPLPLTLGSDAVGEVVELGSDCADASVAVGDRVCALLAQGWLDGPPASNTTRQTLGGPCMECSPSSRWRAPTA
jgi:NADPH:quinone reductase-like Zn-dependent oxidoreductase